MVRFLTLLSDYLERIATVASTVFLVAIFVLVNIEVVTRYIFHQTVSWAEPFSTWLLPWIIFIGLGFLWKRNKHLSVTFVVQKLKNRWPNGFELYVCLMTFVFAIVLLWGGIVSVVHLQAAGFLAATYPFLRWIIYLAVPIGAALLAFHVIESVIKVIRSSKVISPKREAE